MIGNSGDCLECRNRKSSELRSTRAAQATLSRTFKTAAEVRSPIRGMRTALKIGLAVTCTVVVLATASFAMLLVNSDRKMDRIVSVQVNPVPYTVDATAIEHGEYLYQSRGCGECHGADGTGRAFLDHPNGLFVRGANLTRGAGSAVLSYNELDWVRAIRHGVRPDGRPLLVMPSEDFNRLTDADLAAVVGYVRSLAPGDGPGAEIRLPLVARLAYGAGLLKDAAEKIDHTLPPSQPVPVGVTAEHGRYVSQGCIGCHGPRLEGGRVPGAPPEWPPAANLTRADGPFSRYQSADQFKTLLRTGARPDGTPVNPAMPQNRHMNDTDVEALYTFLKSGGATSAP